MKIFNEILDLLFEKRHLTFKHFIVKLAFIFIFIFLSSQLFKLISNTSRYSDSFHSIIFKNPYPQARNEGNFFVHDKDGRLKDVSLDTMKYNVRHGDSVSKKQNTKILELYKKDSLENWYLSQKIDYLID